MNRVEELATAIANLAPEEFRQLAEWFHAQEQSHWDEQLEQDAASGKLDFLFDESRDESAAGRARAWPPPE
ncbi:MAG: hypothetical protein IT162_09490 [Bryobacterales bacterium]|nr:hypothetical protein [Bryobacterales bacterium]